MVKVTIFAKKIKSKDDKYESEKPLKVYGRVQGHGGHGSPPGEADAIRVVQEAQSSSEPDFKLEASVEGKQCQCVQRDTSRKG